MEAKEKLKSMIEALQKENEELKKNKEFVSKEEYETDMNKLVSVMEALKEKLETEEEEYNDEVEEGVTEETEEEKKEDASTPQDEEAADKNMGEDGSTSQDEDTIGKKEEPVKEMEDGEEETTEESGEEEVIEESIKVKGNDKKSKAEWEAIFKKWSQAMDKMYKGSARNDATEWDENPADWIKPYNDDVFRAWSEYDAGSPTASQYFKKIVKESVEEDGEEEDEEKSEEPVPPIEEKLSLKDLDTKRENLAKDFKELF